MVDACDNGGSAGMPAGPLLVVGPSSLFAALVGMLGQMEGLARQGLSGGFFLGMLAGAVCVGVGACAAVCLRGLRTPRGNARHEGLAAVWCAAIGGVTCLLLLGGVPSWLAGVAFGAAILGLALLWVSAYARLPYLRAFSRAAWSLAGGVLLQGACMIAVGAAGVEWLPYVVAGGEVAASGACAVAAGAYGRVGYADPATSSEPGYTPPASCAPETLGGAGCIRAIVGMVWAPVAGLAACVFLLGLLWHQPAPSGGGAGGPDLLVSLAVPLASTVALAVAVSRARNYADVKRLVWTVIPLVAALFLITPNFDSIALPGWNALVEGLQNAGSCVQMLCSFALALRAARVNDVPAVALVGGAAVVVALAGVAGLAVHGAVRQAGNVAAVVLFVVYVCATVGFLAVHGAGDREALARESDALEAYLGPRCGALVARCGLTARESEVLRLLARGHSYAFIAETLYISEATVRTHARNLYRKLGVDGQEGLINLVDAS